MAVKNRLFTYSSTPIVGASQSGNLCISTTYIDGYTWWGGPDENVGYVIAHTDTVLNVRTERNKASTITTNSVGFWRTATQSDASFLLLFNGLFNQNYATASTAANWLNSNGYWTSWSQSYTTGLYKTTYSGYFADVVSFFATATPQTFGANPATSVQTTAISEPGSDDGTNFSCQWLGYFKPTTTETYTFYTSSDDASYAWVGDNAISGFTTLNAVVKNGGLHGTIEQSGTIDLTAGVYYPIRIQFGELNGGDVMTFNFSTPTITKTTNVTGLVFYNAVTNNF
jgi:hypothetical protein